MNIEELEWIDQNNLSLYCEIDKIEFCLFFNWEFASHNQETQETRIEVYAEDCEQWINGICHPYFPSIEEMREVKSAIEDIVLQDLIYYGINEWLESRELDDDYFNEN
jgi:hypothetical protein